jgi:hypothetical protein
VNLELFCLLGDIELKRIPISHIAVVQVKLDCVIVNLSLKGRNWLRSVMTVSSTLEYN